jgi:type II secretory ATPase GspE/PulE/Tfp pilus assembly ATPase PilB-like protein
MAQRLVRMICSECKEPNQDADKYLLKLLGFKDEDLEGQTIYKGAGCKFCHGTGYHGRSGLFELLELNNEIRELAFNRAPTAQLRKVSRTSGMKTLLMDGRNKIIKGVTTPEEVARVAQVEEIVAGRTQ